MSEFFKTFVRKIKKHHSQIKNFVTNRKEYKNSRHIRSAYGKTISPQSHFIVLCKLNFARNGRIFPRKLQKSSGMVSIARLHGQTGGCTGVYRAQNFAQRNQSKANFDVSYFLVTILPIVIIRLGVGLVGTYSGSYVVTILQFSMWATVNCAKLATYSLQCF